LARSYTEKERLLGERIVAEIQRQSKSLDIGDVQQYVRKVGRRIESQFRDRALNYTYEVIVSDASEPMPVMGGHIFVPASLFTTVKDEDEFAVMLAHAIAHIALDHGRQPPQVVNVANVPLIYMGGRTGLHADPQKPSLVPKGYRDTQRRYEIEADRLGIELASRAGYDPAALRRYLQRTQADASSVRLAAIDESLPSGARAARSSASDFLRVRDEVETALSQVERAERRPTLRRAQ
jgi:predicted Zn-dependent protease